MDTLLDVSSSDDSALVAEASAGNPHAFTILMRRYNQRLYRAARSILHDEAEAEDAVQDAWWKAYRHLADFRAESHLATWLTRIAVNEALMRRRRNKSRDTVIQSVSSMRQEYDRMPPYDPADRASDSSGPDQEVWRSELRALLERHIDALPDLYRSVFILRGIEEMSASEVAATLDMPESTVRVRYMRARRLLQSSLQGDIDRYMDSAFSFAGERCDRIVAGVQERIRLYRPIP